MTNYYIEKDNQILLVDTDKQKLINTLNFMTDYKDFNILETERPIIDFQFADTNEYIEEQAQKERERLNKLTLTKRQLLLYMYRTYNKTPEDIKSLLGKSDEALIEFEYASVFLRANPLFDNVGNLLGLNTNDIDRIFIEGASI